MLFLCGWEYLSMNNLMLMMGSSEKDPLFPEYQTRISTMYLQNHAIPIPSHLND
jgi:hypothetical protein